MRYEKAQENDYSGILKLQEKNFILNLIGEEKEYGVLSVEFTKE